MKIKEIVLLSVTTGLLVVGLTACSTSPSAKEAKVSKADAEKNALNRVLNGTIKEAELEKEKGKLIWSFDVATPGTKNITEVNVDAITGEIVAVDIETPEKEGKEAAEEGKEITGSVWIITGARASARFNARRFVDALFANRTLKRRKSRAPFRHR